MEPSERREWEKVAYGREATDAQRNEAEQRLAAMMDPPPPIETETVQTMVEAPARSRRVISWVIAASTVLVLAVVVVVVALAAATPAPSEPPTARPVAVSPARETDLPGGDPVEPGGVDPNELIGIENLLAPDTITSLTDLGAGHGGATAWGVLGSGQQVCVILREAATTSPRCTTLTDFRAGGIDVDRGFWGVRWNPDGTVTWYDD